MVYTDTAARADCTKRFAFAHGTLLGHLLARCTRAASSVRARSAAHLVAAPPRAQAGEERFAVELKRDGSVWYDIFTFSRPGCLLAQLCYPVARAQQRAFARESMAAVTAAVQRERAGDRNP